MSILCIYFIMAVPTDVWEFVRTLLAENSTSLLKQISKLVADSAKSVNHSSLEAAYEQFSEIKMLR